MPGLDCVYIAASARDSRFTRICVASVRYFYPEVAIKLLVGGCLQSGLAEELRQYWNVGIADFPSGDYGWGFVKLEPLFGPPGQRFFVLDSDTVITGPVLEFAAHRNEEFIVDDENQTPERANAIYYDVNRAAQEGTPIPSPAFLFNTGQWFGRSGVLTREHFSGLVEWGFPPKVVNPRVFKNGEQGILNFVANEQVRSGNIRVARIPLMRWPGFGLNDLDVASISNRSSQAIVVHWAGMKKACLRQMTGGDLLTFFERSYYQQHTFGGISRALVSCRHILGCWLQSLETRRMGRRSRLNERSFHSRAHDAHT